MKKHHIQAKSPKKRKKTTNSQHNYPIAPHLLQRQFKAALIGRFFLLFCPQRFQHIWLCRFMLPFNPFHQVQPSE
jgi:hypothetical protein